MFSRCLFRSAEVALCMQSSTLDHTRVYKSYTSPCMHSYTYTRMRTYRHTVIVCVYSMNIIYTQEASSQWCCVVPPNCVGGRRTERTSKTVVSLWIFQCHLRKKRNHSYKVHVQLYLQRCITACVLLLHTVQMDFVYHMYGSFDGLMFHG